MRSRKLLHRISISVAAGFLFALAACRENTVYHTYHPVPARGWARNDTLVYTLPASLPAGSYALEVGVRYKETYPYQNLWLGVAQVSLRHGETCFTDSLQLFLADERGATADNSPGGLNQYMVPFRSVTIREGDSCAFRIVHIMKDNPLKGINDVGLRLRRTTRAAPAAAPGPPGKPPAGSLDTEETNRRSDGSTINIDL